MVQCRNQGGFPRVESVVMPALAVYVHLPWCVRKCPYCDFNSHRAPRLIPQDRYVDALLADLRADLDLAGGRSVDTVFFGGGTPSLFGARSIGRILRGLRDELDFTAGAEVTLEANPGTVEHGCFEEYAAAGVNRVSLGAQSFDGRCLEALGRIHSPGDTAVAVSELDRAGIDNFNLDLMYGLPGQAVAGACDDLRAALALGPAHLSRYQLTLEPGTPFFKHPPALPTEEAITDMYLAGDALLGQAGFGRYEVSAYARAGRQCRHNLAYWTFGDYLGIGAGAHGKLTTSDGVLRTERPRSPGDYMARAAAGTSSQRRRVPECDLPFEYMLNALRLVDGFGLRDFELCTGLPTRAIAATLDSLTARGLLRQSDGRVRPTALGLDFLNDLQAAFLPQSGPATPSLAAAGRRAGTSGGSFSPGLTA